MTTKTKSYGGLAILTAVAASLCCITPVLAFVAGIGGMASTFSWLEPFRPYLIGLTVAFLGLAWYQKLKTSKATDCHCDDEKTSFLQTKLFLGIITVFAFLMFAFPYFSHVFYPDTQVENIGISQENLGIAEFQIAGMTCKGCEEHIIHAVKEVDGIQSVDASYEHGSAVVHFDKSRTNKNQLTEAINATGYKVTN